MILLVGILLAGSGVSATEPNALAVDSTEFVQSNLRVQTPAEDFHEEQQQEVASDEKAASLVNKEATEAAIPDSEAALAKKQKKNEKKKKKKADSAKAAIPDSETLFAKKEKKKKKKKKTKAKVSKATIKRLLEKIEANENIPDDELPDYDPDLPWELKQKILARDARRREEPQTDAYAKEVPGETPKKAEDELATAEAEDELAKAAEEAGQGVEEEDEETTDVAPDAKHKKKSHKEKKHEDVGEIVNEDHPSFDVQLSSELVGKSATEIPAGLFTGKSATEIEKKKTLPKQNEQEEPAETVNSADIANALDRLNADDIAVMASRVQSKEQNLVEEADEKEEDEEAVKAEVRHEEVVELHDAVQRYQGRKTAQQKKQQAFTDAERKYQDLLKSSMEAEQDEDSKVSEAEAKWIKWKVAKTAKAANKAWSPNQAKWMKWKAEKAIKMKEASKAMENSPSE